MRDELRNALVPRQQIVKMSRDRFSKDSYADGITNHTENHGSERAGTLSEGPWRRGCVFSNASSTRGHGAGLVPLPRAPF